MITISGFFEQVEECDQVGRISLGRNISYKSAGHARQTDRVSLLQR
jgi:hypothetical protein